MAASKGDPKEEELDFLDKDGKLNKAFLDEYTSSLSSATLPKAWHDHESFHAELTFEEFQTRYNLLYTQETKPGIAMDEYPRVVLHYRPEVLKDRSENDGDDDCKDESVVDGDGDLDEKEREAKLDAEAERAGKQFFLYGNRRVRRIPPGFRRGQTRERFQGRPRALTDRARGHGARISSCKC